MLQSDYNIKVVISTALTGPSASLGNVLIDGVDSYFKLVNDMAGGSSYLLEFIVGDDGLEPERAVSNMRTLPDRGRY